MKTILLCLLFLLNTIGISLYAQFVTIPDSAFRGWMINHGLATCLNGNQLDTTCSAVAALTYMDCSNKQIQDLTGVEYFRNLDTLICNNNSVDTLPFLPENLHYLNCASNNFMYAFTLPLPQSLNYLDCRNNRLNVMPLLPDSITTLICMNDELTSITNFPLMLTSLNCSTNRLQQIPPLPTNITELFCSYNNLTTLPTLPNGLMQLQCHANSISTIPILPGSLTDLGCGMNNLTSLPALPQSLNSLYCSYNPDLNSLPALPAGLELLSCSYDGLTYLPILPSSLQNLSCDNNPSLHTLPVLPNSLVSIYCNSDSISSLPTLPLQLRILNCSNNQLTSLPRLPTNLWNLDCSHNNIDLYGGEFVNLTITTFKLNCSFNNISHMNTLPPNTYFESLDCSYNYLYYLHVSTCFDPFLGGSLNCSYNQISYIDNISSISSVDCSHNQLTSLNYDQFSNQLSSLNCSYNQISSFNYFPQLITYLNLSDNPIACLPSKPSSLTQLNISNTNIQCVPDYSYSSLTGNLPICQPFNNCTSEWNIIGSVFFDSNGNCSLDSNDHFLHNIPVVLDSAGVQLQRFLTDEYGRYSFRTGYGNYNVRLDTVNAEFQVACPGSFFYSTSLSAADSTDSLAGFAIQCNNGFDLAVNSISPLGRFRPGGTQTLFLNTGDAFGFSGVHCNSNIAGTVQAILSGPVTYLAPGLGAIPPTIVSGNNIIWTVPDFSAIDPLRDFNIQVEVATTASSQDSVCFQLDILPQAGDNVPQNNSRAQCFPILNSFDPNEKYMTPSGLVDTNTHWFDFTIYFQNTGNAPAEMIYIMDTLDEDLDASTFTFLQSSHDVVTQMLPGNVLRFNYANIQLPDSSTNESRSHGFIQYKIKRFDNLPFGTTFSNTAYIHFDFNPTVTTNTVSATLDNVLNVNDDIVKEFKLFPNPAHNFLTLKHSSSGLTGNINCIVYTLIGKPVKSFSFSDKTNTSINIEDLKSGIYFFMFEQNQNIIVRKVVVE